MNKKAFWKTVGVMAFLIAVAAASFLWFPAVLVTLLVLLLYGCAFSIYLDFSEEDN